MEMWLNNLFLKWERVGPVSMCEKEGPKEKSKVKISEKQPKKWGWW